MPLNNKNKQTSRYTKWNKGKVKQEKYLNFPENKKNERMIVMPIIFGALGTMKISRKKRLEDL